MIPQYGQLMDSPTIARRHDGHEDKGEGYYTRNNGIVKQIFPAVAIALTLLLGIRRFYRYNRRKRSLRNGYEHEKTPGSSAFLSQSKWRAAYRQTIYPRPSVPKRLAHHISLLSRGEFIILTVYFGFIMALMWTNVIFRSRSPLYTIKLEVVAFRAGWVSTVQLPLLFATALKVNPITTLTGTSYERMNWIHRWIARFMIITLFLHGFFFTYEWALSKVVFKELRLRPMILLGYAAAGMMLIMVITGWRYLRFKHHKIWIVGHVLGAYAVLALTYTHTRCTTNFVAASVALLMFDALGRAWLWARSNLLPLLGGRGKASIGGLGRLHQLDDEYLRLDLEMPTLRWQPGQHVMLNVPSVSLLQSHPFTISGLRKDGTPAVLIIKRCKGFTDRLWTLASATPNRALRVIASGPFGNPPCLSQDSDFAIFIATGNRASYTYALLLDLLSSPGTVRAVHFAHIIRDRQALTHYTDHMQRVQELASLSGVRVQFCMHITSPLTEAYDSNINTSTTMFDVGQSNSTASSRSSSLELRPLEPVGPDLAFLSETQNDLAASRRRLDIGSQEESPTPRGLSNGQKDAEGLADEAALLPSNESETLLGTALPLPKEFVDTSISYSRPSVDMLLRPAISDAAGEVAIVAAVPGPLAAMISQSVAQMSSELGLVWGRSDTVRGLSLWLECHD